MTNDSLRRERVSLAIGLAGGLLMSVGLLPAAAETKEPRIQVAQAAEPSDPAPVKSRPRKPVPKAPGQAATKAEKPPSAAEPPPTVVPAAPVAAAPAEPARTAATEPVRHAQEARLGRCADMISKASNSTIDTAHAAVSTWSQKGPDDHMFQSIVALSYSNAIAPKAAAVLVAAPEGKSCEATTVQVYPTTRSCGDVEGDLKKAGRSVRDFGGVQMTQEQGASRHLLLPAPGTGCVVVAVGLALNP